MLLSLRGSMTRTRMAGSRECEAQMFERHPWSNNFSWRRGTQCEHISAHQREQYEDHGFFVIDDFLSASEITEIMAETDRHQATVRRYLAKLPGHRLHTSEDGAITFAQHLVSRSPRLRALAADPRLLGIVSDIVGPDANLHWDQAVYKMPDKPQVFHWHQDNGYSFVEPQQFLSIWMSLTDIMKDGGCMWMAPGLHRLGTLRHDALPPSWICCFDNFEAAIPVPVRAGSAVVFSSLTPHMSDVNKTNQTRKAYLLQYAPMGARLLVGDPSKGMPIGEKPLGGEAWRFPVLRGGERLSAASAHRD
jgi:phytanoyl-CoA hydroxylase